MADFTRELRQILRKSGWERLRPGRGDHEIWWNPSSGRKVTVDAQIKSRHTANGVLKQAGLSKKF